MIRRLVVVTLALVLGAAGCKTIGVSQEEGGYAIVSPSIANEMITDNRQVVIFDFRPAREYEEYPGHIAGAISVPLDAIEFHLAELMPYAATTVVVYGSSKDEAIRGARILSAAGFRNVVVIQGGLSRWIDLGYKTVTSG